MLRPGGLPKKPLSLFHFSYSLNDVLGLDFYFYCLGHIVASYLTRGVSLKLSCLYFLIPQISEVLNFLIHSNIQFVEIVQIVETVKIVNGKW